MPLSEEVLKKLAGSLALVLAILAIRLFFLRFVRSQKWGSDEIRMRWHLHIGQATLLTVFVGLLLLWGSEIQAVALSAVAIAAAIVIALKELITCISGSLFRAATDCFTVGDRIEVDGVRGDVISYGLLTTKVLEIGPDHLRTGRAVAIPNSLLLTKQVVSETFTEEFVLHSFPIHLTDQDDWKSAERVLVRAAHEVCDDYREPATRHMGVVTARYGLPSVRVDPRVSVRIPEAGKIDLLLRVPTPARKKGSIEQDIIRRFLQGFPERAAS